MQNYILIIFFILLINIIIFAFKKNRGINKQKNISMIDWMSMSSDDRRLNDRNQRINNMNRKRYLLKTIQKEYKNIANKNKY